MYIQHSINTETYWALQLCINFSRCCKNRLPNAYWEKLYSLEIQKNISVNQHNFLPPSLPPTGCHESSVQAKGTSLKDNLPSCAPMTTFCANLWATKLIPSHLSQYWGCLSWCVAQHWGTSALRVLPFQVKCFHCQVTAPQTGIHVPSLADPRWRVASGTFDCSGIPGRIPTQWEGARFNTLSYTIHRSHSAFIWCSKLRPNITIIPCWES